MTKSRQTVINAIDALKQGGKLSLSALRKDAGAASGNDMVTVSDWTVLYQDGQLSTGSIVTANDPSNSMPVMLAAIVSTDGNSLYCGSLQFLNQGQAPCVNSTTAFAYTDLFNPANQGRQVVAVLLGVVEPPSNDGSGFYFEQTFTV